VKSSNIEYLGGVDQLRGLAAILIILYHGTQLLGRSFRAVAKLPEVPWEHVDGPFSALLVEGHTAVALFMVLSGFIFAYGVGDRDVIYGAFLKNRFLRTYPLFLALIVVGACSFPSVVKLVPLLQTLLGLANFPEALQVPPFSAIFWTVAVEWQFYVLFPFLIRFLRPNVLTNTLVVIMFTTAVRTMAYGLGADPRDISYVTIVGRLDQFLIGMTAGYYYRQLNPRLLRLFLVPATVGILGGLWFFNAKLGGYPTSIPEKLFWPTFEGAMWCFFIVGYLAVAPFVPAVIGNALAGVGTISYSLYLWHFPLITLVVAKAWTFALFDDVRTNALANTALFIVPLSIALSALSYLVVEKPFLQLRVRYLVPVDPSRASGNRPTS
jgi:peptidoglycan/LPS O-acetylase OafA/YrhL